MSNSSWTSLAPHPSWNRLYHVEGSKCTHGRSNCNCPWYHQRSKLYNRAQLWGQVPCLHKALNVWGQQWNWPVRGKEPVVVHSWCGESNMLAIPHFWKDRQYPSAWLAKSCYIIATLLHQYTHPWAMPGGCAGSVWYLKIFQDTGVEDTDMVVFRTQYSKNYQQKYIYIYIYICIDICTYIYI